RRGHPVMIPKVPTVFGHEFAGTVTAVGAGVRGVREGDRVVAANSAPCGACRPCLAGRSNLCDDLLFVNGAYGEFIALPPRLVAKNVGGLGPGLPAARAAFAEPVACALLGIERARVESGQTIVVFGAGPLGCLLGMVAAARKARVILVGKSGWRFARVRGLGIGECLDATQTDDVVAAIRAATGGSGADVAIDATGRPEGWEPRARPESSWSGNPAGGSHGCGGSGSANASTRRRPTTSWQPSAPPPAALARTSRSTRRAGPRCGSRRSTRRAGAATWYSSAAARPEPRSVWTRVGRITRS